MKYNDELESSYRRTPSCPWGGMYGVIYKPQAAGAIWFEGTKGSSSPQGKRSPVLTAVKPIKTTITSTESTASSSMSALGTAPFTSWAYSVAASATMLSGKEYAHHVMLNRLIDRLNNAGLETCRNIHVKTTDKTYAEDAQFVLLCSFSLVRSYVQLAFTLDLSLL